MSETVLAVTDFRQVYGDMVAVDYISPEVQRGEMFSLLGPNPAGETATLACVVDIRRADGSSIAVLGVDPSRHSRKLHGPGGVQLQASGLPASIRIGEAMAFLCAYHRVGPRYDLPERLGLEGKRHGQYQGVTTGQQRRLALALAVDQRHTPRTRRRQRRPDPDVDAHRAVHVGQERRRVPCHQPACHAHLWLGQPRPLPTGRSSAGRPGPGARAGSRVLAVVWPLPSQGPLSTRPGT